MRLRWFLDTRRTNHNWCDLIAFIDTQDRTSALARLDGGEEAQWGLAEYVGALTVDNLMLIRHALTAKKGTEPPTLLTSLIGKTTTTTTTASSGEDGDTHEEPTDLNDRNTSGTVTAEAWSTDRIAESLGWDYIPSTDTPPPTT